MSSSSLVYAIDEIGCTDWEERKPFRGIVLVSMARDRIHISITRKIHHQTILVYIKATEETLCSLIVTPDRITRDVFHDGIEEYVELRIHVGRSNCVNIQIFMLLRRCVSSYDGRFSTSKRNSRCSCSSSDRQLFNSSEI
jgi:hypothetical protein